MIKVDTDLLDELNNEIRRLSSGCEEVASMLGMTNSEMQEDPLFMELPEAEQVALCIHNAGYTGKYLQEETADMARVLEKMKIQFREAQVEQMRMTAQIDNMKFEEFG